MWHVGIYDSVTGEMINPKVLWTQPDGGCLRILAKRAVRVQGVWTFSDVAEYQDPAEANMMPVPILVTNLLAFPAFSETPEQIASEIKVRGSFSLITSSKTKKADISITEILNFLRLNPNPSRAEGFWLYTKLQGRLAAPWTCLVVVLIAVPFGVGFGRRNVFVGVASSIFICFTYFVLQQVTLALGTGGYLPPWLAAWLPNLTFGAVGLGLTARVR